MGLVYDLGGGTFDISVLMWGGATFAQLNLEGDMWLGGDNFDQKIIDYVVQYVRKEFELDPTSNIKFMSALRDAAQEAKETLSEARTADLIVSSLLQDENGDLIDVDIEITREQFEQMIRPLVDKTVQLTVKALEGAGLQGKDLEEMKDQIDYVIMAGNCTCIPIVRKAMEDMFTPAKVLYKVHPKQSVAMGAAVTAIRLPGIYCPECGHFNDLSADHCASTNCNASLEAESERQKPEHDTDETIIIGNNALFHYGTQSARDEFNLYIKKNDSYETPEHMRKTLPFYTRIPNQRMIRIPVYGGEHLDKASKNTKQGEAFAVLPPNLPKGSEVYIKLWLDSDGIFDLEAHLNDGTDLNSWITNGGFDQKKVDELNRLEAMMVRAGEMLSPERLI